MCFPNRPCPICGSLQGEKIALVNYIMFDGCALEQPITMLCCQVCGLIYNEIKNSENLSSYYKNQSLYGSEQGSGSGGYSHLERRRYQDNLNIISKYFDRESNLLVDVGCAKGGFLTFAKEQGFTHILGIDMNRICLDLLSKQGIPSAYGSAESIPLANGLADLIYSNNVLEHVYNMSAVILEARRALKDNGLLYIEAPESENYAGCCFKSMEWLVPEHVNFISKDHLAALMESNGFTILEAGYGKIYINNGAIQPSAYILGRKERQDKVPYHFQKYQHLKNAVSRRLADDLNRLGPIKNQVAAYKSEGRKFYMYGLGWAFSLVSAQLDLKAADIKGYVDRNPMTRQWRFNGQQVLDPDRLNEAGPDDVVIIFSIIHVDSMKEHLKKVGFCGLIIDVS